jgi:hypothetical protein
VLSKKKKKDRTSQVQYFNVNSTGETWVSFVNVETKEQPKQWININTPKKSLNKGYLPGS